ncbi:uncharacterized protein PHACADRAFT_260796 [Phanerochaete carnosa HHB-10118-sp]|uniref:HTH La-type RNA-binding domain-containing protein n=1 Tax=Phanerochaete carnosa (strain HHB-10118-sp) TaxID=650164 RepID=K5VLX2_PHACS|nr:uncharacterized protein PHACADRAFT_260796 [Phanerochaete carnosa HHB-10118-sp]EKM52423.1 hypothetical protein PHACADRAFT_260796 [Phanerochaete carnosa HHB-10118-sp]
MATVSASSERLAELKAGEDKPETANTTTSASDADLVTQEPAIEATTSAAGAASDATTLDEDEKDKALRAVRQIEFYFADANLPYDKFMWTLHTANPEHWVPIATVASFKRMREFVPLGTDWLVNALKSSTALEVDETNTKVRRRTEVTEPKGQFERSIYAKGFGEEVPGLQQKLEAFFNQYGRTNAVRMRREENTKRFKGSIFVEFDDMSSVEKFLNADPKPAWDGQELLIMSKEAYCEMKIKEKGLTGKAASLRKESMTGAGRKGFNAFKEMSKIADDKKGGKAKAKPEVWLDFLGQRIRVYEEDGGTVKTEDVPFVKGATFKFEGVEGNVSFDEVKGPLKERFTRVPFVQYNKGDSWGYVAFDKALTEEDVTYIKEKIGTLGSKPVTWAFLDEETEKAFQIERASAAAKRALHFSQRDDRGSRGRGRGGARGGRGGRGGGRGREKREGKNAGEANPAAGDEQAGDKRKRTIEPDGGAFVGTRGQGVPTITSAKKAKTDDES